MPSITEASTSFFRKRRQEWRFMISASSTGAALSALTGGRLSSGCLPGQPVFSDAHVQFKRIQLVRFSHSFRDSLSL